MDPKSGSMINITKLYGLYTVSGGSTDYQIDLSGERTFCSGQTVVCKLDKSQDTQTPVGLKAGRQFYIEDDIVEVELKTNRNCDKDPQKKVTSIIQFHCNPGGVNEPEFLFDSVDCTYMFTWENPFTCAHPIVVNPQPIGDKTSSQTASSSDKSKTVGTIVAVFLTAIVICLLLIVFHKKERRDAVISRIRSFTRKHSASYRYTELPSSEEADDLLPEISANDLGIEGSVQTSSNDDEVNILQSEAPPPVCSYHDDSDEELLA